MIASIWKITRWVLWQDFQESLHNWCNWSIVESLPCIYLELRCVSKGDFQGTLKEIGFKELEFEQHFLRKPHPKAKDISSAHFSNKSNVYDMFKLDCQITSRRLCRIAKSAIKAWPDSTFVKFIWYDDNWLSRVRAVVLNWHFCRTFLTWFEHPNIL